MIEIINAKYFGNNPISHQYVLLNYLIQGILIEFEYNKIIRIETCLNNDNNGVDIKFDYND